MMKLSFPKYVMQHFLGYSCHEKMLVIFNILLRYISGFGSFSIGIHHQTNQIRYLCTLSKCVHALHVICWHWYQGNSTSILSIWYHKTMCFSTNKSFLKISNWFIKFVTSILARAVTYTQHKTWPSEKVMCAYISSQLSFYRHLVR